MNFVEGTRLTPAKHARQASPFAHLLKPKAGGVAFVLDAMGSALHSVVDVTIAYPAGNPSMLDLVSGRIPEVRVRVCEREIPGELLRSDYANDAAARVDLEGISAGTKVTAWRTVKKNPQKFEACAPH